MFNAYRRTPSLACPLALKAAVAKARVLTANMYSGRGNPVALVNHPVAVGARFECNVGAFIGPLARQRFLAQLG